MKDGTLTQRASTWPALTRRGLGQALVALTLATGFLGATPASAHDAQGVRDDDWIGTWTASPSDANPSGFTDQTLRLIVHTSIGGREVRVRLSNAYGAQPLTVGAAQIALQ